ncbi:MAG: PKD domain-containing protein, partial [Syntrophus sp. (in: bacteria)]
MSTSTKAVTAAAKVNFTCTESVTTGQPIVCTAQSTPVAGETLTYTWTVNKGAITAGQGTNQVTISSPVVGQTTVSVIVATAPVTLNLFMGNRTLGAGDALAWNNYSKNSSYEAMWSERTNFGGSALAAPAGGGYIKSFRFFAYGHSDFKLAIIRFVSTIGSSYDGNTIIWLSPTITPVYGEMNTWIPAAPVRVEAGDKLAFVVPKNTIPSIARTVENSLKYRSLDAVKNNGTAIQESDYLGFYRDSAATGWVYSAEGVTTLPPDPILLTKTANVTVLDLPTPVITSFNGPITTMEGKTEQYTVTTDASDPATLTFTWDVNGVSYSGSAVNVSFPAAGSYNVTVTAYPTGRPDLAATSTKTVTVAAKVNFTCTESVETGQP